MLKEKTKIILTGYRATGKTTIGRLVALQLDFAFLDTDREIEIRQGRTISSMVTENGWPFFRTLERQYLTGLVDRENLVVAPGGGAVLHQDIWQQLMESSLVVWLRADARTIIKRINADAATPGQRPALTDADMTTEVKRVLAERDGLYRAGSHLILNAELEPERLTEAIVACWRSGRSEQQQSKKGWFHKN